MSGNATKPDPTEVDIQYAGSRARISGAPLAVVAIVAVAGIIAMGLFALSIGKMAISQGAKPQQIEVHEPDPLLPESSRRQ